MTDARMEMINHDLGIFIDHLGLEYPVVCYLDADGERCPKDEGDYAIAGIEGRWFTLDLSEFDLTRKDVMQ